MDENGESYTIYSGPPPTKEEVLGRDADLRSQEELEGGKVLNGAEAETLESMLWDERRDRRGDDRRQRGPFARPPTESSYNRSHRHKESSARREKQADKPAATPSAPSGYSAGLATGSLDNFFSDVNLFASSIAAQPVAGPSSVTLDQMAVSENAVKAVGGVGVEEVADQSMEPNATAENAE